MTRTRTDFERDRAIVEGKPADAGVLWKFCYDYADDFLGGVIEYLDVRLLRPPVLPSLIYELVLMGLMKEREGRTSRGLPLYNALSAADMRFVFGEEHLRAAQQLLAKVVQVKPSSKGFVTLLGEVCTALGDLDEADRLFSKLRDLKENTTAAATRFDRVFHSGLKQAASSAAEKLPVVSWPCGKATGHKRAIYASCDYDYFQIYGWALIESLRAYGEKISLVMHIMDMTEAEAAQCTARLRSMTNIDVSVSTEWTGLRTEQKTDAARGYYHAVRFIRFLAFLEENPACAGFLVDIDLVFRKSPAALFQTLADADVAVRLAPGRIETRNKVHACYVGVSPSADGRAYIRDAAGYIATLFSQQQLAWGVDQVALFAVLTRMLGDTSLKVAAIPAEIADGTYADNRVLWISKEQAARPGSE